MNPLRILSIGRLWGLMVMSLFMLTKAQSALASGEETAPLFEIAERSNAIYLTEITDIAYHTSLPNIQNDRAQPFTFITYKVLKTLRGKARASFTLRFLGGAYKDGTVMALSNQPEFDKGDKDILFVSGNTLNACPLANCAQGRFRIIDGYVYSDNGQSILDIKSKKEIGYGQQRALKQVLTHTIVNPTTGAAVELTTRGAVLPESPLEINAFTEARFIDLLTNMNQGLPPPKTEEISADPKVPFFSYHLQIKQPRSFPIPVAVPPEFPSDELEKWAFEANGGNPVLP